MSRQLRKSFVVKCCSCNKEFSTRPVTKDELMTWPINFRFCSDKCRHAYRVKRRLMGKAEVIFSYSFFSEIAKKFDEIANE